MLFSEQALAETEREAYKEEGESHTVMSAPEQMGCYIIISKES